MKRLFLVTTILLITAIIYAQEKQFEKTCKKNTIEAFDNFLTKYPLSEYTEEVTYRKSKIVNTSEAFKIYLNKYPAGKYTEELINEWCTLEYKKIKLCENIDTIRSYIQHFDDCRYYRHEIKQILYKLEFEKAEKTNTLKAYYDFQIRYPSNKYVNQVENNIQKLEVQSAIHSKSIDSVNSYYTKYPNNVYLIEFKKNVEEPDYIAAKQKNTAIAFQYFLKNYPESYFKHDALFAIEKIYYDRILESLSISDCDNYLENYPQGHFKIEVEYHIKDINMWEETKNEDWHTAYNKYIKKFPNGFFVSIATEWIDSHEAQIKVDYPNSITGGDSPYSNVSSPFFKWKVTFSEIGGKASYKVKGQGWYFDNEGKAWGNNTRTGKTTEELYIKSGGSKTYDTWFSGEDFKGGYIRMNFTGEDAGGHKIEETVVIHCK